MQSPLLEQPSGHIDSLMIEAIGFSAPVELVLFVTVSISSRFDS